MNLDEREQKLILSALKTEQSFLKAYISAASHEVSRPRDDAGVKQSRERLEELECLRQKLRSFWQLDAVLVTG